mgnify:CR=1 FL=1
MLQTLGNWIITGFLNLLVAFIVDRTMICACIAFILAGANGAPHAPILLASGSIGLPVLLLLRHGAINCGLFGKHGRLLLWLESL